MSVGRHHHRACESVQNKWNVPSAIFFKIYPHISIVRKLLKKCFTIIARHKQDYCTQYETYICAKQYTGIYLTRK